MLSQLGSVFKTTFRQTESADARLDIPREERDNNGKKKEQEKDNAADAALWEDSMAVSTTALHSFLVEFLKSHGAPLPQGEDVALSTEAATPQQTLQPVSSVAAKAMKAYTAMAPTQAVPTVIQTPAASVEINPADLLDAEEIRAIHTLITDVDALTKAGVQTLNITMVGTFLESLIEAVRLTKTASPL